MNSITTSTIISILCGVLPFANGVAIVLTESGIPAFRTLYASCVDETIMGNLPICNYMKKKICRTYDYRNNFLIDFIVYLGIILCICKNTLKYGYATAVARGMVLIVYSVMLPNMFLSLATHKISNFFRIHNPYLFILVGMALIVLLIGLNVYSENIAQKLTRNIKIDPLVK